LGVTFHLGKPLAVFTPRPAASPFRAQLAVERPARWLFSDGRPALGLQMQAGRCCFTVQDDRRHLLSVLHFRTITKRQDCVAKPLGG
jgi:hypothetical protein